MWNPTHTYTHTHTHIYNIYLDFFIFSCFLVDTSGILVYHPSFSTKKDFINVHLIQEVWLMISMEMRHVKIFNHKLLLSVSVLREVK